MPKVQAPNVIVLLTMNLPFANLTPKKNPKKVPNYEIVCGGVPLLQVPASAT